MPGEFDFVRWVRAHTPPAPGVLVGPGDDCAVLAPFPGPLVVTTDVLTEGVDFVLAAAGPAAVGYKAMTANLSDLAAMAAGPVAAVVGLVLPRAGDTRAVAEGVFGGLRRAADQFGVAVVGGDTNTWAGGLVVSVTLFGYATPRGPVLRSGAKVGDRVFVTGPLGGSLAADGGGRHLTPVPRVAEALALHQLVDLHAMADISDGLAADLGHILDASRCGVELAAAAIPVHPDAVARAADTGRTPLAHALTDGEDFELVFTVSEADAATVRAGPVPVSEVGRVIAAGAWLVGPAGRQPLGRGGWAHDFGG